MQANPLRAALRKNLGPRFDEVRAAPPFGPFQASRQCQIGKEKRLLFHHHRLEVYRKQHEIFPVFRQAHHLLESQANLFEHID